MRPLRSSGERTIRKQRRLKAAEAAGLPEQRERTRVSFVDDASKARAAESLENRVKSGIIKAERPKEIPEMSKDNARSGRMGPLDVTRTYLDTATPNSHTVQDLECFSIGGITYKVDGCNVILSYSAHEKEIAELLEQELGGELYMMPKVNSPQGVRMSDYLFRGRRYDLKTLEQRAAEDMMFQRVKKAKGQARRFVVDVTKAERLSDAIIDSQIQKIFRHRETGFVEEVIIVRSTKIYRILKRA